MIRFVDLHRQYLSIKEEIDKAIQTVLDKSSFILGEELEEFERNFANFCNVRYCLGVSSGTDALHLALRALDVGPGDEVITVANSYVSTAMVASYCGAKPVLVDCSPESYLMDIGRVEEAITSRTKVIIPVHLYGQAVDMDPLLDLAKRYGIRIVEDACQAHGAMYKGKKVGSLGDIGCFSFYPGKNLGAYGDGGAITTNDEKLAEKLMLLRNYGQKRRYYHSSIGYNARLDNLQAAILNVKLKHLEAWNSLRHNHAQKYNKLLSGIKDLSLPSEQKYIEHVYHLYVVRTPRRDELWQYLKSGGIETGIHYPVPIHLQEAYSHLGYKPGSFPIVEGYANTILSLPMFPELREEELENVSKQIRTFLSSR